MTLYFTYNLKLKCDLKKNKVKWDYIEHPKANE